MSANPKHLRAVDKQILIEFYKIQYNDIYDMNNLDWRVALIFVPLVGAFSAIVGIFSQWGVREISNYTLSIQAFALVVFLLSLYGLWTVAKGQAHTILKFKTLSRVERDLNLNGYTFERPERWWSIFLCRRVILYIIYSTLGWFSLTMTFIPVDEWSLYPLKKPFEWFLALFVAFFVAIIFVLIHYGDYKLHLKNKQKGGSELGEEFLKEIALKLKSIEEFLLEIRDDLREIKKRWAR